VECVPQDGVGEADEAAAGLEAGGEERTDAAVRVAVGGRTSDRGDDDKLGFVPLALGALGDLALDLGDDGVSLSESVEVVGHFEVVSVNEVKTAIAPRS
jgi:hypothetical protein